MLQQESPNSFRCNPFLLPEESIKAIGQCRRSAALEAFFFSQPPTHAASSSLWKLFVFGQQLHRPLSGEHHHPLGADEASLPLLFAQTAHFPLVVRATLGNAVQQQHIGQHRWGHGSSSARRRTAACVFGASQQHIVFCLRISSILLSYCHACGVLIWCVCVLLRFVVNAEAEKIRIFAAAHLQRSRWSTENVPLSPESETRYGLKAAEIRNRGCVLTAPLYRLLLERQAVQIFMKMLSSCLFFVKFLYVSAR